MPITSIYKPCVSLVLILAQAAAIGILVIQFFGDLGGSRGIGKSYHASSVFTFENLRSGLCDFIAKEEGNIALENGKYDENGKFVALAGWRRNKTINQLILFHIT